jgi:hypothetical protein
MINEYKTKFPIKIKSKKYGILLTRSNNAVTIFIVLSLLLSIVNIIFLIFIIGECK